MIILGILILGIAAERLWQAKVVQPRRIGEFDTQLQTVKDAHARAIANSQRNLQDVQGELEQARTDLDDAKQEAQKELQKARAVAKEEADELKSEHELKIQSLTNKAQRERNQLNAIHADSITQLKRKHQQVLANQKSQADQILKTKLNELDAETQRRLKAFVQTIKSEAINIQQQIKREQTALKSRISQVESEKERGLVDFKKQLQVLREGIERDAQQDLAKIRWKLNRNFEQQTQTLADNYQRQLLQIQVKAERDLQQQQDDFADQMKQLQADAQKQVFTQAMVTRKESMTEAAHQLAQAQEKHQINIQLLNDQAQEEKDKLQAKYAADIAALKLEYQKELEIQDEQAAQNFKAQLQVLREGIQQDAREDFEKRLRQMKRQFEVETEILNTNHHRQLLQIQVKAVNDMKQQEEYFEEQIKNLQAGAQKEIMKQYAITQKEALAKAQQQRDFWTNQLNQEQRKTLEAQNRAVRTAQELSSLHKERNELLDQKKKLETEMLEQYMPQLSLQMFQDVDYPTSSPIRQRRTRKLTTSPSKFGKLTHENIQRLGLGKIKRTLSMESDTSSAAGSVAPSVASTRSTYSLNPEEQIQNFLEYFLYFRNYLVLNWMRILGQPDTNIPKSFDASTISRRKLKNKYQKAWYDWFASNTFPDSERHWRFLITRLPINLIWNPFPQQNIKPIKPDMIIIKEFQNTSHGPALREIIKYAHKLQTHQWEKQRTDLEAIMKQNYHIHFPQVIKLFGKGHLLWSYLFAPRNIFLSKEHKDIFDENRKQILDIYNNEFIISLSDMLANPKSISETSQKFIKKLEPNILDNLNMSNEFQKRLYESFKEIQQKKFPEKKKKHKS